MIGGQIEGNGSGVLSAPDAKMAPRREQAHSGADTRSYPRSLRLLKPEEFQHVFAQPLVSQDRYFRILARDNGSDRSRLGLAVSKRMDRRATVRNRVKRIVRESFRQYAHQLSAMDIVAIGRHAAPRATNQQLFESLAGHWRSLNNKARSAND